MDIEEYNTAPPLIERIEAIQKDNEFAYGIARIKRDYLRPMTNEAFILTIQPVLQGVAEASVFFIGAKRIYILWKGNQKKIFKHLRNFVGSVLTQPGADIALSVFVSYINPCVHGQELIEILKEKTTMLERGITDPDVSIRANRLSDEPVSASDDDLDDEDQEQIKQPQLLQTTSAQRDRFNTTKNDRPYRKQLQILVAEDQVFSQKLLCEIIRGARAVGQDAPATDAVTGIQEAWKLYLKKAHDIVFVDLGLVDGSGHALARAMKELDPSSCVIIVTANNFEEELGVARQNNVDGFIAKPYNKKQILDCIDRYIATTRTSRTKGIGHGAGSKF